jgi:hypothetical protein
MSFQTLLGVKQLLVCKGFFQGCDTTYIGRVKLVPQHIICVLHADVGYLLL